MKRFALFLLIVALLMGVAACSPASKASQKGQSVAKQAIETLDDYLDGNTTLDSAREKLFDLHDQMSYTNEYAGKEKTDAQQEDWFISHHLLMAALAVDMDSYKGNADTYDDIIKQRNELAALVGIKKR